MDQLRTVSIANRLRLLIAIFALSFLAYGLWSYKTLLELKVGGPLFSSITESHDLVSDVLPPPLYIIESYLVCLQLSVVVDGKKQGELIDQLKELHRTYLLRHAQWAETPLLPALADTLLVNAHEPAAQFYALAFDEFLPALHLNDHRQASTVLTRMTQAYDKHRAAIDRVVSLAQMQVMNQEAAAYSQTQHATRVQLGILLAAIFVAIALAALIQRSIQRPLQRAVDAARRIASGDLHTREGETFHDETGQLLAAIDDMSDSLRNTMATAEREAANAKSAKEMVE